MKVNNIVHKCHKPIMEQKKPNTKTILNDFIYMRFESKDTNLWCQKSDSRYLWLGSHGLVAAEESEGASGCF